MYIRDIRGLLPLVKSVGQSEAALFTKVRDKILRAAGVKFKFVNGFTLRSLGPAMADNASGVVVALVGFDSAWPVLTETHERLPARYRAKLSLLNEKDDIADPWPAVEKFGAEYCERDLLVNPTAIAGCGGQQTIVPPVTMLEVTRGDRRTSRTTANSGIRSRLESIRYCGPLRKARFDIDVRCWLNFPLPAVVKLMQEKLEPPLDRMTLLEYDRTSLGPWTVDKCLKVDDEEEDGQLLLDTISGTFALTRVLHRGVLEDCFSPDAWHAICQADIR